MTDDRRPVVTRSYITPRDTIVQTGNEKSRQNIKITNALSALMVLRGRPDNFSLVTEARRDQRWGLVGAFVLLQ
jgi:hypothetical protein